MKLIPTLILCLLLFNNPNRLFSQHLYLPNRNISSLKGSDLVKSLTNLSIANREAVIFKEICEGNIPSFLRMFRPITISNNSDTVTYFVLPDYLALGPDTNFIYMPMTPILAQKLANHLNCILPTKKMVDQIYSQATIKLKPQPIPPSPSMITFPIFVQHNDSILTQLRYLSKSNLIDRFIAGSKKDIIISNKIYANLKKNVPKPVVIYGWHTREGNPIQPTYNGHNEQYADYSHGVRLILDSLIVNGRTMRYSEILKDTQYHTLISDEGFIKKPYYTIN